MMHKKDIIKKFERIFDFGGDGKLLSTPKNHRRVQYEFRNRKETCFYYIVSLKGNHIRLIRTQTVLPNGEPVNVFLAGLTYGLSGEPLPNFSIRTEVLLKLSFSDYKEFFHQYVRLTPDLHENPESLEQQNG